MNDEILKCDKVLAYLWVVSFLIISFVLIFISLKLNSIEYKNSYDRPSFHIVFWFISFVSTPLLLVGVALNLKSIIQIKMAPKHYISENYTTKKTEEK